MTSHPAPNPLSAASLRVMPPVLERLVAMNLDSLEHSGLDLRKRTSWPGWPRSWRWTPPRCRT